MLARSGRLPTQSGYAFEFKWDGFRAIVSTEHGLRIRSRRGWNMSELVPELGGVPVSAVLDGELVAFQDGQPDFPRVCERFLQRDSTIPITFIVFDVLSLEGEDLRSLPYWERREVLEGLGLEGTYWSTSPVFDDAEAVWDVACERELEGGRVEAAA
jgi:bifunctional non-homologous end joining protein LigD